MKKIILLSLIVLSGCIKSPADIKMKSYLETFKSDQLGHNDFVEKHPETKDILSKEAFISIYTFIQEIASKKESAAQTIQEFLNTRDFKGLEQSFNKQIFTLIQSVPLTTYLDKLDRAILSEENFIKFYQGKVTLYELAESKVLEQKDYEDIISSLALAILEQYTREPFIAKGAEGVEVDIKTLTAKANYIFESNLFSTNKSLKLTIECKYQIFPRSMKDGEILEVGHEEGILLPNGQLIVHPKMANGHGFFSTPKSIVEYQNRRRNMAENEHLVGNSICALITYHFSEKGLSN